MFSVRCSFVYSTVLRPPRADTRSAPTGYRPPTSDHWGSEDLWFCFLVFLTPYYLLPTGRSSPLIAMPHRSSTIQFGSQLENSAFMAIHQDDNALGGAFNFKTQFREPR